MSANLLKQIKKEISCKHAIEKMLNYGIEIRQDLDSSSFFIIEVAKNKFFVKILWGVSPIIELASKQYRKLPIKESYENEFLISQCLNDVITSNKICPHIAQMITTNECTVDDPMLKLLKKTMKVDKSFLDFINYEIHDGILLRKFKICVFELLDFELYSFINDSQSVMDIGLGREILKSILFQIAYTLHILQTLFPRFSHHDLHAGNIMLKVEPNFDSARMQFIQYRDAEGVLYYVPYFGIIAKIIDFGFSSLPEMGFISSRLARPTYPHHMTINDFSYLINSLKRQFPDIKLFEELHFDDNINNVQKYTNVLRSNTFSMYRKYEQNENSIIASFGDNLIHIKKSLKLKNADRLLQEVAIFKNSLHKEKVQIHGGNVGIYSGGYSNVYTGGMAKGAMPCRMPVMF